jgi:hypothetical protein
VTIAANAPDRNGRRTVLVVGPDFTPSSYPPALRIRFFAQHLRDFGWEPVILTVDASFYEWAVDCENYNLLPADLEVIRTRAFPASLTRKLGFGDLGLRSLWHHWHAVRRLCRSRRIDLIYIPVPPNYSMVLGRLAHARFGIPYVIDYIDPVVTDYYWKLPRAQRPPKYALAYGLARLMEPFALKRVSGIVGVDISYTTDLFTRYNWLRAKATGIPYGGEPADFDYVRQHPRANPFFDSNDGLLHLSYVGRGGPDMVAVLRVLFAAIRAGHERWPELFSRLRLHFVGTTYAHNAARQYQVLPVAHELGVENLVDEHPERVPYLTALQILLDSHALIVLGSDSAHYTASKIFPYILAARPLLAIFHEKSSVVDILEQTEAGHVVTFGTNRSLVAAVEEIIAQLRRILLLPSSSHPPTLWDAFAPYTARSMAARLASVFDNALGAIGSRVKVSSIAKAH